MHRQFFKRSLIASAVSLALLGTYAGWNAATSAPARAAALPTVTATAPAALPDMSAIIAANGPAVVNITASGTQKMDDSTAFGRGDLPEFLRRFGIPTPQQERPVRGFGSGFIVSADGLVLTNAHVVDKAERVTVKLTDKREFKAKVLGVDKATDVAVLKIEAKNLPAVKIGTSANTRVGEWVLAIGSPFGFENSASAGIISAKSRALPDEGYVPFIQTDVAVNPGNSGGPLFNLAGEVVGINSQIYSRTGGYQGLSFAIPIDVAMKVKEQIVAHGKVERGRLGVTIQPVDQALADSFGLKKPAGALVSNVEPGSPAAKAGLETGDVILGIDGKTVESSSELPPLVADVKPGTVARLEVWRQGSARSIEVKVGSLTAPETLASAEQAVDQARLGVTVRPPRPGEADEGLVVQGASGAAAKAGIRPGDVLLSVNGEKIEGVEQLRALIAKADKKKIAVLVQRDSTRIFIPVDLG